MVHMGEASGEKALGSSVQRARRNAGLTQQQLCQQAGISYSTLAKIERGAIKTPSVFTVATIARVLNISMDELMGVVVDAGSVATTPTQKRTSTSGISFLYLDINGCLVRFFHGAFTQLSHETGVPSDIIESTFWHYNDAVCRGEMSMSEFNQKLAHRLGLKSVDWQQYYMDAIEPISEMQELLSWAATHYRVGLLSNIMPGFIRDMIDRGLLPNVSYDTVIDSSETGLIKPEPDIYELAQSKALVDSEEILFVDDSRTNLMAAERLGWRVMWFDDYDPASSVERIKTALAF